MEENKCTNPLSQRNRATKYSKTYRTDPKRFIGAGFVLAKIYIT